MSGRSPVQVTDIELSQSARFGALAINLIHARSVSSGGSFVLTIGSQDGASANRRIQMDHQSIHLAVASALLSLAMGHKPLVVFPSSCHRLDHLDLIPHLQRLVCTQHRVCIQPCTWE